MVRRSMPHRFVCLQLRLYTISVTMSHASPTVTPPSVLRANWKTLARFTFRRNKLLDLDVCPVSTSLCRSYDATNKPKIIWFWGSNQETVAMILRHKSPNQSCQFWEPNRKICRPWFWGSTKKPVDLSFQAQPRNPSTSSPCAQYRSHTVSSDLSIVRPPRIWPMLDYLWPSALYLILLARSSSLAVISHLSPTHHETNKHDCLCEIKIKIKLLECPGFKFKHLMPMTHHSKA
jgi:hypothetical protein